MAEQPKPIEKMPTGITGFDIISGGGLPRNSTTLVLGSPGAGKTNFALQTLINGARDHDEPGIFISFEEDANKVIRNVLSFGWDIESLEPDKLFFLDARLSPELIATGKFDFIGLLAGLRAKAEQMQARRIVFDSLDVLLQALNDRTAERNEAYRLHEWLSQSGMTGILTARLLGHEQELASEYGFLQFMVDCAVVLQRRIIESVSLRGIRIIKYRGSDFAENEYPLTIGQNGVDVAVKELGSPSYPAFTERASTGIDRLDTMLEGGYFKGSSTLITGSPGTAKSTLAATFSFAACQRGERTLYISFDEASSEIIRNMRSISLDLQPSIDADLLRMESIISESKSPEEHLMQLRKLIDAHQPACLVIDPISGLMKSGNVLAALDVAQRLIYLAKQRGITFVCTSLLDTPEGGVEATPMGVSTIADTWIHLAYLIHGGERNRTLTIIKARGTAHSNQVRELILSRNGIDLADVYSAGGEVLLGTLRYEKEQEMKYRQEQERLEHKTRQRELEEAASQLKTQIASLQRELEAVQHNLSLDETSYNEQKEVHDSNQRNVQRLRGADLQNFEGDINQPDKEE